MALAAVLVLGACSDTSPSLGRYKQGRALHLAVMEIDRVPEVRYATIDPEQLIRQWRLTPSEEDLELVLVRLRVENHTATNALFTVDQQGAELRGFERDTYFPIDVSQRVMQDLRGESSVTVHISGGQCFDPNRLNIDPGTTVGWVNDDEVVQSVSLGAGSGLPGAPELSTIEPGESYSYTFNEPGVWKYQCGGPELPEAPAQVLVDQGNDSAAVEGREILFIQGPFQLQRGMGIDGWMVFEAPKGTKFRDLKWRAGDSITIYF